MCALNLMKILLMEMQARRMEAKVISEIGSFEKWKVYEDDSVNFSYPDHGGNHSGGEDKGSCEGGRRQSFNGRYYFHPCVSFGRRRENSWRDDAAGRGVVG